MKLSAARLIIENAQKFGHDSSFAPLAIVVLDGGGKVVASERQDGASMGRHEIAFAKAYGALALGVGSRALMNRAEQQPYFTTSAGIALGGRPSSGSWRRPGVVGRRDGCPARRCGDLR